MDIHDNLRQQGLIRPTSERVLGGVFAGVGERLGLDPWPTRVLGVATMLVLPGSQLLLYPVLWALMPGEREQRGPAELAREPEPAT